MSFASGLTGVLGNQFGLGGGAPGLNYQAQSANILQPTNNDQISQAYGQAQWEKSLQPQVLKYQALVKDKYDQSLGPHVDAAVKAAIPYYNLAKTNALQTYYEHILPTYAAVQPYALQGYDLASDFTLNTAVPYSKWAWTTGIVFLDRTVLPKLRILYGENVEPQLVRIGERLGRYRDGKRLKAVEEVDK